MKRFPNISAGFQFALTLSASVVTGGKRISQLKLIKSHNHVAREIGGSSHLSVMDIVSQFAKKDQKDKV